MKESQHTSLFALLSLLSFFVPTLVWAQQKIIRFHHISLEQGLSQSTVDCLLKDRKGYMWFGTRDGLNKYDGYKITVYRHDPKKKETIGNNAIYDIVEDDQGRIWIATATGLERFDRERDSFLHVLVDVPSLEVRTLFPDRKGQLWVGTRAGLYWLDSLQGRLVRQNMPDQQKPTSLLQQPINDVVEDEGGELWLATNGGLGRYNPRTRQLTHYRHQANDRRSLRSDVVKAVFKDSKGRIWVGLRKGGVALFDRQSDSFISFEHDPADANTVAHNDILSFAESKEGELWIGTENGGISVLNTENGTFATYKRDNLDPTSLSNNSVHSLYRDDQGSIWAGTWADGVNYFPRFADKFTHYNRIPGTNSTNIYAICGDWEGKVWLGLENEGLLQFNPETHAFRSFKNPDKAKLDASIILSIKELNKDTLALACRQGGFALFDKTRARFTPFLHDDRQAKSISKGEKNAVWVDRDQNIWIGDYENGLSFYNRQTESFVNYLANPQDSSTIGNGYIRAMCEDQAGNLWIGTEGGGLSFYDRTQRRFRHYGYDEQNKNGLSSNQIQALLVDRKGNLWIGTYGAGLQKFDPTTGTFRNYTQQDGLPHDIVEGLLEDGKGELWISTNHGISRFNPRTNTFRNYDTEDGLQANAFNRNACYKTTAGVMYFGGTNGFNVFHPDSIQDNPHIPPIVLTDFQIFNHSIKAGDRDYPLTTPISEAQSITLSYAQSVFSFEFAALDFTLPDKNQYAYRLEGFDDKWNPTGTQRKATYTNLNPGEYTFRVRASNNDGIWNKEGISVKLIILPPFWLTWWFKSTGILLVMVLTWLIYRLKTRQIIAKNRELEARVTERTQKIELHKQEIATHRDNLERLNLEISKQNEALERKVEERTEALQTINERLAVSEEGLRQTLDHTLQINNQLTESKAILAEAQRIAHLGSWELDLPHKVTWSEETYRIFGRQPAAGLPSYEEVLTSFFPECRDILDQAIQAAIHQGKPYEMEVQILTECKQVRWALVIGKPVLDAQGKVVKLIGTIVDINEHKLAEEQLKQQNQELLKINAELDRFVYRASHDLRAPLSSLLGLIDIAKGEANEKMKEQYFRMMEKSVVKLDTFIQSIINYSKNARLEVNSHPIDFQELVDEIFDDLKYMDRSSEINKHLSIIGESAFFSDAFRLKIIFSNIISNAIRYSNPQVASFIHIHVNIDEQQTQLEFSDNGYGIAPESIDKIFEMFYRASQENVGSGLGLYIVKEVVQALEGSIQVQSELSKGTSFIVRLPNLSNQQTALAANHHNSHFLV